MTLDIAQREFQQTVWDYYQQNGRHDLPWRQAEIDGTFDPYKITVSEIMLQQTQVKRVIPKYHEFLNAFPSSKSLADSELGEVLRAWSGLGYNRRAKFLWQAMRQIESEWAGAFPKTTEELMTLPGIGKNTAGAIKAYVFNEPAIFVETNIRTVVIYHFFQNQEAISDKSISEIIKCTLPTGQYREWYWALMDYGSFLKQTKGNFNTRAANYARQSKFEGSLRQIRGQIIRLLGRGDQSREQLLDEINDTRAAAVIESLLKEGMIRDQHGSLSL